jgi:hypothetical protein
MQFEEVCMICNDRWHEEWNKKGNFDRVEIFHESLKGPCNGGASLPNYNRTWIEGNLATEVQIWGENRFWIWSSVVFFGGLCFFMKYV